MKQQLTDKEFKAAVSLTNVLEHELNYDVNSIARVLSRLLSYYRSVIVEDRKHEKQN